MVGHPPKVGDQVVVGISEGQLLAVLVKGLGLPLGLMLAGGGLADLLGWTDLAVALVAVAGLAAGFIWVRIDNLDPNAPSPETRLWCYTPRG